MPSLSELRNFKASFDDIGRQKTDLRAKGIPFDDFPLPDSEPVPLPAEAADAAPADILDSLDFGAFLESPPPDIPDPIESLDAGFPDELLSGLAEELDTAAAEAPGESDEAFDLDSLDSLDLGAEPPVFSGEPGLDTPAAGDETFDLDSLDSLDLGAEPPVFSDEPGLETPAAGEETFDLDSLDLGAEPPVFSGGDEPGLEAASAGEETFDLDSLDSLDLGAEPPVFSDEPGLEAASAGDETFDLDSLDSLDLGAEPPVFSGGDEPVLDTPAAGDETFDLDSLDSLDLGAEPPVFTGEPGLEAPSAGEETFDLDSLDSLDLGAEPPVFSDEPGLEAPAAGDETFDLDSLDSLDLGAEPPVFAGGDEPPAFAGGGDSGDPGDSGEEPPSDDSYDPIDLGSEDDSFAKFDPGAGVGKDPAAADSAGAPAVHADLDDFDFPDLDHVLGERARTPSAAMAGKPRIRRLKEKDEKPLPKDFGEIELTDDELRYLEDTLSRYPLNLRIACGEIITGQSAGPEQIARLIRNLIGGTPARDTAILASQILGRTIIIPKSFQKSSGAELEAEQASFSYIFIHNFLPVLRLFLIITVAAASLFLFAYRFIYTPLRAESIYKIGYERIAAGEYQRANERFREAFTIHPRKVWFYRYAEAFRDTRQYLLAEEKYEELLRYYPRDKKGVLDYAHLQTYFLRNYEKADHLLRRNILDYAPNDFEGLLAVGDNKLAWGEVDPSKYEDARFAYSRLLEQYGWERNPQVVERMMLYFIRTDNLSETLYLRRWFDVNPRRQLTAESLAELGGYLLDKRLEEPSGVPNEFADHIENIRDLLLAAVFADTSLPEPHYHLARYYLSLSNSYEERITLELALRAFENDTRPETVRRMRYRIDSHQRLADNYIRSREFFPAERNLVRGIELYDNAMSRRLMQPSPDLGRLYAGLGDLEYFVKTDDMDAALRHYRQAQQNQWAPPDMRFRMGRAYYQLEDWGNALEHLFAASSELPQNRRVLYALGNAAYKQGNYFAAQGYYSRLLDILETQRSRLPVLLPNDRPEFQETAERLMMARNNAGAAHEMLAAQTGDRNHHTRAMVNYADASRAWDSLTRDPDTMIRHSPLAASSSDEDGVPLPFLNSRNALRPQTDYEPQIFIHIDREALDISIWEEIAPFIRPEQES